MNGSLIDYQKRICKQDKGIISLVSLVSKEGEASRQTWKFHCESLRRPNLSD